MAKIRYGGLVSDIRGSVGGVTFRGGAGGGVLSSKAIVRRSRSAVQVRQMNVMAESRRAWLAMSEGGQRAFAFVYGQKVGFRPAVGQSWGSVRGAYSAWYVGLRMCGVEPGAPDSPMAGWGYDGGGDLRLLATGFYLRDGFYAVGSDVSHTPLCVWGVRYGASGMPPARPVWTLVYCGLTDEPAEVVTVAGVGSCYDLTPFLIQRGSGVIDTSNVIFRGYRANNAYSVVFNDMQEVVTG